MLKLYWANHQKHLAKLQNSPNAKTIDIYRVHLSRLKKAILHPAVRRTGWYHPLSLVLHTLYVLRRI